MEFLGWSGLKKLKKLRFKHIRLCGTFGLWCNPIVYIRKSRTAAHPHAWRNKITGIETGISLRKKPWMSLLKEIMKIYFLWCAIQPEALLMCT